ncbi:FAA-hydrolase domain-containing protein [Fusarium falciforme]|uniref:FAA-hydrolase domain-containing protein n=1 Tax=Fusarium falciforme TaxID=195108 RepID=UPI002301A774|nr:FAA-hydrolase domain-containing protein [Fusarium falciforme]WAO86080.1 FAA-hydrolase domain-containing protein [Fusarium falciforme]
MSSFSHLIRFECEEDDKAYFADLGLDSDQLPSPGTKLGAFKSFDGLINKREKIMTLRRFAPIGPTLICPEVFADNTSAYVLTRVNGEIRQKADLQKDMIFPQRSFLAI